jgi:hypothetical protein
MIPDINHLDGLIKQTPHGTGVLFEVSYEGQNYGTFYNPFPDSSYCGPLDPLRAALKGARIDYFKAEFLKELRRAISRRQILADIIHAKDRLKAKGYEPAGPFLILIAPSDYEGLKSDLYDQYSNDTAPANVFTHFKGMQLMRSEQIESGRPLVTIDFR